MKNILFDLSATQPSINAKRHGGGIYGEIVFRRIVERGLPVSCFYDSRRWFNPDINLIIKTNNIPLYDLKDKHIEQIIQEGKFQKIYSCGAGNDLPLLQCCDVLATEHGLREIETPVDSIFWRYKNNNWKAIVKHLLRYICPRKANFRNYQVGENVRKNPHFSIVTVSHHSKCMMLNFFPWMKSEDVPVFYSPSTTQYELTETRNTEKYFLMVSGNRWGKNVLRGIMAFDKLFSQGKLQDFMVKISGVKDASLFRYKIKNPQYFEFLGYVDDLELDQLYHDAYCLLYPSLNEGFGYPPLEAMHYGVPVLAAAISAIPEVCGEAVIYFTPFSVDEMVGRILLITEPAIHENYSQLARKRYAYITAKQKQDLDALVDYIYL